MCVWLEAAGPAAYAAAMHGVGIHKPKTMNIKVTVIRRVKQDTDDHETAKGAFNSLQYVSCVEVESIEGLPIISNKEGVSTIESNTTRFTLIYLNGGAPPMKVLESRDEILQMMETAPHGSN